MDRTKYFNPLTERYASSEMQYVFSDDNKFTHWRKLWIALAEAEKELGLSISDEQIEELKSNILPINYETAAEKEKEVRHDVMAHVYAYGQQCPKAMPIIHLGATSCYVGDNTDIIVYKQALEIIKKKVINVLDKLKKFALKYKATPTLGFTHLQPAQLVTVGKRATLWMQDLLIDLEDLNSLMDNLKLRGAKGTTGTQATFLQLFNNDHEKVKQLDQLIVKKLGFNKSFAVTGQTYPRKIDYKILSCLSSIAQSAYKFSNDIRILQNMKEIEEPFEKSQIGSSAMAYKRNPMRSERMGSLARYVITMPQNAAITASTQWFERTLDDSANKRIVMSESFLALDAILEIYLNVSDGLVVNEKVINKHIFAELPFMATENILMSCVVAGGNRQELHEKIRKHSMEAARVVKQDGGENDLIERILTDDSFVAVHGKIQSIMNPKNFIGRSESQVDDFIVNEIDPILNANKKDLGISGHVSV